MVYQKQFNIEGDYIDNEGLRYDVLSCERTESKEWYDTGEVDGEGNPIWEWRIVINKGWDAFESEAAAAEAYGLTYDPLPEVQNE